MTTSNVDLHIIGGGIIGLAAAVTLQARGVQVALLDAHEVGQGASLGNAGHIATEQVFPIADASMLRHIPAMLLNPTGPLRLDWRYLPQLMPWAMQLLLNMRPEPFARIHQALLSLNQSSLQAWQDFATQWQLNEWVQVNGSLLTVEKPSSIALLNTHAKRLNDIGVTNELLTQDALLAREPALQDNQLAALFFPDTGHITNLKAVIKQLTHTFRQLGGQVFEHCRVLDATVNSSGIHLTTSQGDMNAAKVMLSAGAHSKTLAKQLTGVNVPLETERGYHLMLPQESTRLQIPVSSMDRRFIMTPMEDGLRLAGTVEYAGLDAPPNMQQATMLLQQAQPMLKTPLNATDSVSWMGFRPSTADSLPIIDKVDRVFLNFGHQHLGLTQAVVSAQMIAEYYFDEDHTIDPKPYQLARFK
ncbi:MULTISPECIES: FAD-dependent oxidoreductase [unclassified Psychrobacter]|uniref:NAD(P)/FAD-dependent oxidoreductase n=1 Tax=unclassified Psychrobacter TaxID=196806 RepID=UPI0025B3F146|nr:MULTISPECIES: FAD-dependent oxidoreductase [unclassified Psychrobacter]MDN3452325.1 FAD-dependent oxidoreductase [Psychrobacter sp. APC 3350]MDN3502258.1 FAD-dependent oxidoreductase [Psychrobacter sp. 5A.1]